MRKLIFITLWTFLLFSCSQEEKIEEKTVEKQDFFVEVKNIDTFSKKHFLEKTWRLSSTQDIKLSSKVSWKVKQINVRHWDVIKTWDILAVVDDDVVNYSLSLDKAKNALDKASLNYQNTQNQLNKQISDLKINLSNLEIDNSNSSSSLELDKIENSIKKLAIDYDNLKISNLKTISGFNTSLSNTYSSLINLTDNVIEFSDKILWITDKFDEENDSFEDYLWVKDLAQKRETKNSLIALIDYRKKISNSFDEEIWFEKNILIIQKTYSQIDDLLVKMNNLLDNSVESVTVFPETTIDWYKTNIDTYQTTSSWNNSSFVALQNSINSFLDTYKNSEDSLLKQIELLESDKKIYIKSLDTKLEIDESSLDQAIKNKELTLKQLNTVIIDARLAYKEILENIEKFTIKSPINWIVWDVFIDLWQDVNVWTQLFSLVNNKNNEVLVSFNKKELGFISLWNDALVNIDWLSFSWSIYSISNVADSNFKYVSHVVFENDIDKIWELVKIKIPFETQKQFLPVNILKVVSPWKARINILENWEIKEKTISIWDTFWDMIEISEKIDQNLEIIVNDVSNFDKNKFNLKIK